MNKSVHNGTDVKLEHHFNDTLYKSGELVDPVPPPQRIPSIDEASTVIITFVRNIRRIVNIIVDSQSPIDQVLH